MEFTVRLRLANETEALWESEGPRRVALHAVVVDGNGSPWPMEPIKVRLSHPLPPRGCAALQAIRLTAPYLPGRFTLLVGLVEPRDGREKAVQGEVLRLEFEVREGATPALVEGGRKPGSEASDGAEAH